MIRMFLLFLTLSSALTFSARAQTQYHYHYFKEQRGLQLDLTRVAIQLAEGVPTVPPESIAGIQPASVAETGILGWRLAETITPIQSRQELEARLTSAEEFPEIDFVSPVFLDSRGGSIIVTSTLLIGFEESVSPQEANALLTYFQAGEVLDEGWGAMRNTYRVATGRLSGLEVLDLSNTFARLPQVRFAEPDMIFNGSASLLPDDTGFGDCWGLHNIGQAGGTPDQDMDAVEAWDLTTGDDSVIIVVIDTGIQQDHPDINQIPGADTTSEGPGDGGPVNECDHHGTLVAGAITARINNALGTVGIAPDCRSASARTFISVTDPCNGGWTSAVSWTVDSLVFAESVGARVTCNSNGYGFESSSIATKYDQTRTDGMVHFAATGNSSEDTIYYPSSIPSVNAVNAIDRNGSLAAFSNTGVGMTFTAPGVDIYTTDRTSSDGVDETSFATVSGTSLATPYAAGVAALVLSLFPTATADDVESYMQISAVDLGVPGYDTDFGWGLVNALGALSAPSPPTLTVLSITTAELSGGAVITLIGQNFGQSARVKVGQVDAFVLSRQGSTAIEAEIPEGPGENVVVDVSVLQPGGVSTLPSAFTYIPNEPDLEHSSGNPSIGNVLFLNIFGEAGESFALLADGQRGSCVRSGITLGLACTPKLRIVHNSFGGFGGNDPPLGLLGKREVSFRIPNSEDLINRSFHMQAVVRDTGNARGITLVPTPVVSLTVLP